MRDLIIKVRRWIFYKGISLRDLVVSFLALLVLLSVIVIFSFSFFAMESVIQ